jgi:acid phosphatase family membrane protein YuiD
MKVSRRRDLVAELTRPKTPKVLFVPDSAGAGADMQPLDSDLTAIAALTTTSFGRSLLELANAAAALSAIGAAPASHTHAQAQVTGLVTDLANKQPLDGDLTAIAALSTSSFGRSLLELANAAAARTLLGLSIGTNVQAWDADLDALAAVPGQTAFGRGILSIADAAAARTVFGAAASSHTHAQSDITNLTSDLAAKQPLDSDLTAIAALTTTSFGRSLLALVDAAAGRAALGAAPLASPTFTGDVVVPDGNANNEAVNYGQLQTGLAAAALGYKFKAPVKWIFSNTVGAWPAVASHTATTLTGDVNFIFPGWAIGDRVLVANQGARNGIYTVTTVGVLFSTPWVLTRASDAMDGGLSNGTYVEGLNSDAFDPAGRRAYFLSTADPITVGTTVQTWSPVGDANPVLPRVRALRGANQSISNTTQTPVTFPSEDVDTHSFHDLVTNSSRLTIPTGMAGTYLISAVAVWASNATGWRQALLLRNGANPNLEGVTQAAANGITTRQSFSVALELAAGDYIELAVNHNSGAALNITNASLQMVKVG